MSPSRLPKDWAPVIATALDIAAFPPTSGKRGARSEIPGWLIDELRERFDALDVDWRAVKEANDAKTPRTRS